MIAKKIYMRFPKGLAKALTLSYDDGVQQDKRLIEILDRYGLKCTFNLNSGLFSPEGKVYPEGAIHRRMTERECVELYANSGHEVAVHAYSHPFLEKIPAPLVVNEIVKDRENLERLFGGIIRGMAYPYGTFNDEVVDVLRMCGIAYSRTVISAEKFSVPTDWLRMSATCHHNNSRLMELAKSFAESDSKANPKLFYLWGHSYEFDEKDNWNVIEEFSEYMGGREDVWYATNIEIYDYVESYRRLIFSMDRATVMNPTALTLYFEFDNEIYTIASGETVTLKA